MAKRVEMSITSPTKEIMAEIFARLPAKSVGRCRCLAKFWRTELSTAHFIKSQLKHSSNREHLVLIGVNGSANLVETGGGSRVFRPEAFGGVLGSCDGLVVMVRTEDDAICVVNPFTSQLIVVPFLDLEEGDEDRHNTYGLGCSEEEEGEKEYKVVALSIRTMEAEASVLTHVYSLQSRAWRRVVDMPFAHVETRCGAFLNGAIHWLGRENGKETVVVVFDLKEETFGKMSGPTVGEELNLSEIAVVEGCLCLVFENQVDDEMEVWTMNEYNIAESWTRVTVHLDNEEQEFANIIKPVCLYGDDEIIFLTEDEMVMYDVNNHVFRQLAIEGGPDGFIDGYALVDSLVSPLPATTEPATEPLPAAAEPLPAATEPLPAATEPLPAATEPLPAAAEPSPDATD